MIFESMWPLALLLAVPVVIILYLLKPRGKDYRNSSNLLWEKIFKNQQSKTFLEKFIHNILMYVQILILLLMVLALMSPYLHREGVSRGNVILVMDTSGSMQHDAGEGKSRLSEAVDEAKNLIASSEETAFSVLANDCRGTQLLAVASKDKGGLYGVLDALECCDGEGNLKDAESVVDTLRGARQDTAASVIVFTDGNGAEPAMSFSEYFDAEVQIMGEAVNNVAVNFLSYAEQEGCVAAASLTNYSDVSADLEISLYAGEKLVQIRQVTLAADETSLCYFDKFDWDRQPLKCELSSVRFAGAGSGDSLAADNTAYAVADQASQIEAVLIGSGNTYIEKAYQAATGKSLAKSENAAAAETDAVQIYDAGAGPAADVSRMVFADSENAAGTKENVLLTVSGCDLTAGLPDFTIGVNETKIYEVPAWGTGFLWAGEECAGYYGEKDGVKIIVAGFDIRESDFPLTAEFPVFISNAVAFLGDTSLLADNTYEAGEEVIFHPQADFDVSELEADTAKAGLYEVGPKEQREAYVVRFAASQSEGRLTAGGTAGGGEYSSRLVKKQLRNVLLAVILLLLVLEWILYVRQMRYRGKFYLAVRAVLLVLLVLALCNVGIHKRESANTTVFLVDISNSNAENLSEMESEVKSALQKMPKDNRYGIVTFGKNSLVEQFLTEENHFSGIMSLPDKTATNFEEAISRALAMIPADGAGRIVILTDGKETKGDITGAASALVSRRIELLAKTYEVSAKKDVYMENVELPSYLHPGDAYTMTVAVESNYETDAELQVWSGTIQTEAYSVHLNSGTNQFKFRQKVEGGDMESFEVRVAAPGDGCEENNSYHAYSVVESAPKVLLVSGMDEDSGQFEALLSAVNVKYNTVSAINAPDTLETLLDYKSIILENVYLADLPEGFLENVETYVKDYGNGLICCGGEDSFALGGYRESVLEQVLPVDMQLRGVNEIPSMVMVMIIDHSGSMSEDLGSGATNLDLAITAAETAVDQLRSSDYVGVLTFDDRYEWVVKPTLCEDKQEIKDKIETVAEGGGTTIKPSLWAALKEVTDCEADIRHVVLLTDGQGETSNYSDVTAAYKDADVTLSTVGVGTSADNRLLEQIAESCGGRYYYSDMAEDIPKIFAQEVFLSGDTYLQNGEFALAVNGGNEITRGLFAEGWPVLHGYVSATPKNSARQLIASEKDDPVLTVMQYGLGHTVAWNTDVTNQWTSGFAGQEDYAALWRRIVDYSTGNAGIGEDSADVITAHGVTKISYRALDYGEKTKVEAVYTDPEGNTNTAELTATAPGQYETKLDTDMSGVYNLSVRRIDDGEISNAVTTAAVVQYSDEYKFRVSAAAFLKFVENYGRMLEPGEDFWKQRKSDTRERYELAKWLILLAVLWFVMDIAFRRFHFLPQDTRLYQSLARRARERKSGEKAKKEPLPSVAEPIAEEAPPEKEKKPPKEKKRDKKKSAPQTLDTSALLKKKDQRQQ
ncbi:MAG: VWA domain-containing protein [Blautia sp.]|nr:VWA domain-containing protein [Blautia sp.]